MSIRISPETVALFGVLTKKQVSALGADMIAKYDAWMASELEAKELANKMENFLAEFGLIAKNYFDKAEFTGNEAEFEAAKYLAAQYRVIPAKSAKNPDVLGDSWAGKLPAPEKIVEIVERIGRTVTIDEAEGDEGLGRKAAAIVALESAWRYERDLFRSQLGEIYSRLGIPSKPVESIGQRAVELRRQYAVEVAEGVGYPA